MTIRKSKKGICLFLTIIIAFAMSFGTNIGYVSAETRTATISSSTNLTTDAGGTISVPINISNYSGIMGMGIKVTYDDKVLKPVSVSATDITACGTYEDSIETSKSNSFIIEWANAESITSEGTIFNIIFEVSKFAKGDTNVDFSCIDGDTFDENFDNVSLICNSAKINVIAKETVVYGGEGNIEGNILTIPVNIKENIGVAGFRITMKYDPQVLTPVSIEKNGGLTGILSNTIGDLQGTFDVLWTGSENYTADGTLYTAVFEINNESSAGSTTIEMSYDEGDTCDEDLNDISFTMENIVIKLKEETQDIEDNYSLNTPKAPVVSTNVSGTQIKWAIDPNADGYYIYRGNVLIKTITANTVVSFLDTAAKGNGVCYSYKIEAFANYNGKEYRSDASAAGYTYFVTNVRIKSVSNSAKKTALVKWTKNAKANGYQVKYITGSTSKVKTVAGASKLSVKLTKLKKGKKYKIYVRPYKTVAGKKYYGVWTPAKSIKIKK